MQFISRLDRFLGAYLVWFTLGAVALGVIFDGIFSVLLPITPALFAFMTFANTLGSSFRKMGEAFSRPLPILTTLVLLHAVIPLLCLGICRLLFADAPLFIIGLVLEFAIPTGVVSLMWVSIGRGNLPLCLSIVLLDTLLSPLVVPLTLRVLVGSIVEMDTVSMMLDLLYMVGIPALLALLCYRVREGRTAQTLKQNLAPFAKLSLLTVTLSNATSAAPFLKNLDGTLALVIAVLLFMNLFGYFLGYVVSLYILKTDFPSCQSITLTSGLRNISAGAVLAAQYFPSDVMFPVAFSPVFTQLTLATVTKVLRKTRAGQADQAAYEAALASQPPNI